jgi:competence protein ComEC
MPSYDIFFFSIVFFLIGILVASFGLGFSIIIFATALLVVIFLLWKVLVEQSENLSEKISRSPDGLGLSRSESRRGEGKENFAAGAKLFWFSKASFLAFLVIFVLVGAAYYQWDDANFRDIKIDFNETINFSGLVVNDPQYSFNTQTLTIKLDEPYQGKIQVKLRLYPQYHYGDKISFKGKIENLPAGRQGQVSSYANYLAKEGISGLANFPDAQLEKSNLGSPVLATLFKFKNSVIDSYQKVLSPQQAALLAGLTFGERGNLDKNFKKAMSLSGTTHLTALSGQNITIIVIAISATLGFIFPQFLNFIITILVIFGFVTMTGFDPSVVRAMIMGFAVLLADLVGRIYDPRNSIALAAFLITLFNPKSLLFDVGFQLSFLAVLGIVYLRPALKKILRFDDKPGFLAWRENLLMTLSAQLATAPVLIVAFGSFSLLAFFANILVLLFIPLTMGLGFFLGLLGLMSHYLALIVGFLVSWLLNYEIFIINLFAEISLPISPNLGFFGLFVYYLLLLGIVIFAKLKA